MRYILALTFCLFSTCISAQDWEDQRSFGKANAPKTLRIISSTDTAFLAPAIDAFLQTQADLQVEYLVQGTATIDDLFRQNTAQYDLVISSAMDLQLKLVNDGLGQPVSTIDLPRWAKWRDTLFAFTKEPAAIVINRAAFSKISTPETRQDLITALRNNPEIFQDKIATYDVRTSGLGYLFATQDARASETYWRLMEVMGGLGTQLYCCSGQMIDDLISGDIVVAYNVLGSYALAREDGEAAIDVILPSDFPTTMMRTIFVSKDSQNAQAAEQFIQFLTTRETVSDLPRLDTNIVQSVIPLNPALLIYLDRLKRRTFINAWENAVVQ